MWVKDGKHGLTSEEADQLLAELRACAFASVTKNQYGTVMESLVQGTKIPVKFGPPDYYFRKYWSTRKYFGVSISFVSKCLHSIRKPEEIVQ